MKITFFEGQSEFLQDYEKATGIKRVVDETEVLEDVMKQLDAANEGEDIEYRLPGSKTKSGKPVTFPFSKQLVATDMDATISSRYFYEGSPHEIEERTDEQM